MHEPSDLQTEKIVGRHGAFHILKSDRFIGKSLKLYGEWAENETRLLCSLVGPGDTVLDVGANFGTHTVPLALRVGPSGRCIGFEPQKTIFKFLSLNMEANCPENSYSLQNVAVGPSEGEVFLKDIDYSQELNFGAVSVCRENYSQETTVRVAQISLDSLNLSSCKLMKIDVEGFELEVLHGAKKMLRELRPIVYLECNDLEDSHAICRLMSNVNYMAYYITVEAFNSDNYFQSKENIFGLARESSLLFVPTESEILLKSVRGIEIFPFESQEALEELFGQTIHPGDVRGFPTRFQISRNRAKNPPSLLSPNFIRPVTAIIFIDDVDVYLRFLKSLSQVESALDLNYLVITRTPEMFKKLNEFPRSKRSDLFIISNIEGESFVSRIWGALASINGKKEDFDLLILESSSRFSIKLFVDLQRDLNGCRNGASIVPSVRADFFKFPVEAILNSDLTLAIEQLGPSDGGMKIVGTPRESVLVRGNALKEIGYSDLLFDRTNIALWFKKVKQSSWENYVSYLTFLEESEVRDSASINALYRVLIINAALRMKAVSRAAYLFVLHADSNPKMGIPGGTERHSLHLMRGLRRSDVFVMEVFSSDQNSICLRSFWRDECLYEERFPREMIGHVLKSLQEDVDVLHVQHLFRLDSSIYEAIREFQCQKKIISFHDFYQICPSINMLRSYNTSEFCNVEPDVERCNKCLKGFRGYEKTSMDVYRARTSEIIESFDLLLFPSESVRSYFFKALPQSRVSIEQNSLILGHSISHLWQERLHADGVNEKLVVFLGAFLDLKGGQLFLDATSDLIKRGFKLEIIGETFRAIPKGVRVTTYNSSAQLSEILQSKRPGIICTPSITAETFCFSFYEGMILGEGSIPVVGPFGNPAKVVEENRIGTVLGEISARGLVEAIENTYYLRESLRKNKRKFLHKIQSDVDPTNLYISFSGAIMLRSKSFARMSHGELARLEALAALLNDRTSEFAQRLGIKRRLRKSASLFLPNLVKRIARKMISIGRNLR